MNASLPPRVDHDGLPLHSVSSLTGAGAAAAEIGAVPAGDGRPQCGQTGASVETSRRTRIAKFDTTVVVLDGFGGWHGGTDYRGGTLLENSEFRIWNEE
jgi:hypothetical protein